MAWGGSTPTLLDSQTSNLVFSSLTTGSVSPSASALVIAFVVADGNVARTLDDVSSGFTMSTAWSESIDVENTGGTGNPLGGVWWGITAASPGSGTVTATLSGNKSDGVLYVIEVASGFNSSSPIAQTVTDTAETTSTSPTVSFSTTPDADNLLLGAIAVHAEGSTTGGPDITPGSGWTEFETPHVLVDEFSGNCVHADGSNGAALNFTLAASPAPTLQTIVGIEIAAAAGGDSTAPTYGTSPALDDRTDIDITVDATASDETDATVNHYAVVIADGGTAPSGAQVAAGTDGADAAALDSGSHTGVSNAAEGSITLGGSLSPSTAYDVYYTVRDSSSNYAAATLINVTTRPGPTAAAINAEGTTLTLTMSESVSDGGEYSESDFVFTASGGALTATATSGLGSTSIALTLSRVVQSTETITYNHTQPGTVSGGLEATTGGVWLPSWTGRSITNNSVQVTRAVLIHSISSGIGAHPSQDLNGLLET